MCVCLLIHCSSMVPPVKKDRIITQLPKVSNTHSNTITANRVTAMMRLSTVNSAALCFSKYSFYSSLGHCWFLAPFFIGLDCFFFSLFYSVLVQTQLCTPKMASTLRWRLFVRCRNQTHWGKNHRNKRTHASAHLANKQCLNPIH